MKIRRTRIELTARGLAGQASGVCSVSDFDGWALIGARGSSERRSRFGFWGTVVFVGALGVACGTAKPGGMSGPTIDGRMTEREYAPIESADILRRTRVQLPVSVKHVLIGWNELADNYRGQMDKRATARNRFEAEDLMREIDQKLRAGAPIEILMIEHSGDKGTADGSAISVRADSKLVPGFVALSTRLENGEHGIVKTEYGYHLIKRVK